MGKTELSSQLKSFFDMRSECWGCKDLNSTFVYVNASYAEVMGVRNTTDCIGLTDFDFESKTVAKAPEFLKQDQYVIEKCRTVKVFDIHRYSDGVTRAHIFTKTPWIDNNKVVGTIFSGEEITQNNFTRLCVMLANQKKVSGAAQLLAKHTLDSHPAKLSRQEKLVVYFLVYGRARQDIAHLLNIKVTTVDSYLEKIKAKFGVSSKKQLIDAIIHQSLINELPLILLPGSYSQII
tara:strand:- start:5659 stop:6363 length:705 start_codon:yes stop_codon:yes gene_type:complete